MFQMSQKGPTIPENWFPEETVTTNFSYCTVRTQEAALNQDISLDISGTAWFDLDSHGF